ncbi:RmlC-like cupin domain-containing protein [Podospora fimiseda]|uniref:RmlC-like cupin domain-containing protein n=1 Tax=Podospora fimiseda TaxID=252190 RepID=A0AAN7H3X6_9PEZI|nr:RmlC-like cupin domain-containing protein [Podospora fimiseda]
MSLLSTSIRRSSFRFGPQLALINTASFRPFSSSIPKLNRPKMAPFKTPSSDPPKHEMQYFPSMTTSLPAESHEFRRVLWTGLYSQVVLMTVPVGGDIGEEIHTVDQILTFTSGKGLAQVGGKEQEIKAGDMVIVPAGTKHQFLNKGEEPLVLYTVYSPAEHKATTVHKTKEEGEKAEEEGGDEPPEWSQRGKRENERDGIVRGE